MAAEAPHAMTIGVARESVPGEPRVALVLDSVAELHVAGFEVVVEPGAGTAASIPDEATSRRARRSAHRGRARRS
jgi:NAD/NADP transhydrogenase alpha subunit